MTKKKFFASLGVMTALVGTAVFGAMLCMGNASADAAALKDEVELASAAVSLKGAVAPFAITDDLPDIDDDMRLEGDCPKCGQSAGYIVLIDPTCTKSGTTNWKCGNCGTFVVTTPAAHNFAKVESVASTSQYCTDRKYTCTNCSAYYYALSGTTSRTAHHGTIVEKKASTCIEAGYNGYQCNECDYTWREELPLAAHTPDAGKITQYATCTEAGVKTYSCAVCGAVDHTEAIPATGHTYPEAGEGIVSKAATCTEPGIMSYTCTVCGQGAYTEPIQALGHQFELIEATEPTCTEPGHGQYMQCTRCEVVSGEINEIPATGHKWTEWEETRESCDVAGERTRTCTVCDEVESEELEAGAHSWDDGVITKAPTCTESGVRTKTCELCGEEMTETVDAIGHKPAKMAAVAATCTKTGLTEGERCTTCGITLTAQQVVPALGHDLVRIPGVEPTVVSEGNIEYWHCSSCGSFFLDKNGKTEISADDTILDRLPAEGVDGDGDAMGEDDGGMSGWQIALAVVAGVVLLAGIGLALDKFVFNKDGNSIYDRPVNKAKSKGKK